MSQTGNKMIDHKGRIIASKGSPKDTSGGKNLGKSATNKFATPGCNPDEASPSSTSQSRNKSYNTGGY
jgi:hypothetical protein